MLTRRSLLAAFGLGAAAAALPKVAPAAPEIIAEFPPCEALARAQVGTGIYRHFAGEAVRRIKIKVPIKRALGLQLTDVVRFEGVDYRLTRSDMVIGPGQEAYIEAIEIKGGEYDPPALDLRLVDTTEFVIEQHRETYRVEEFK